MTALRISTALVLAVTGCFGRSDSPTHDPDPVPDPAQPPPPGGGSNPPPQGIRGPQKMSDVHVEPGGERVWIVHHTVADLNARPTVDTARLAVFVPDTGELAEVLDTTGTLGKRILFPTAGRVLYVTQAGTTSDIFVSVDSVARKPLARASYPGNRNNFRVSPTGRAVISTDATDRKLHLLDTSTLVDQAVPSIAGPDTIQWAPGQDVIYALQRSATTTELQRYDLRTADLGHPVAPPSRVATLPGAGLGVTVSLDHRHAAVALLVSGSRQVALVDTTTGNSMLFPGDAASGFTRDGRAIVWQPTGSTHHDLRLVDPVTGNATPSVATEFEASASVTLRDHDALLVQSASYDGMPFVYSLADGTQTEFGGAQFRSSLFERPGHPELWMWTELGGGSAVPLRSDDGRDGRDAARRRQRRLPPGSRRARLQHLQALAGPAIAGDRQEHRPAAGGPRSQRRHRAVQAPGSVTRFCSPVRRAATSWARARG